MICSFVWIPSVISAKVGHGLRLPPLPPFPPLPPLPPVAPLPPLPPLPRFPPFPPPGNALPNSTEGKQASTAASIFIPILVPAMHSPLISSSEAHISSFSSSEDHSSEDNSSEEKAETATRQKGRRTRTFMTRDCLVFWSH